MKIKVYQLLLIAVILIIAAITLISIALKNNEVQVIDTVQEVKNETIEPENEIKEEVENTIPEDNTEKTENTESIVEDNETISKVSSELLPLYKDAIKGDRYYYYSSVPLDDKAIWLNEDTKECSLSIFNRPFTLTGTFEKKGNTYICKSNTAEAEEVSQPIDEITVTLEKNENVINIVKTSRDAVKIHFIDLRDNSLMDDTEDMNIAFYKNEKMDFVNYNKIILDTYKKYKEVEDYQNSNIGPMPNILVKLGLSTEKQIKSEIDAAKVQNSNTYIKSNVKYEDFKAKMLEMMTEEYFEAYYSDYKNMDGFVGYCNCGGGIIPTTILGVLSGGIDDNEKTFTFNLLERDDELYSHFEDGEIEDEAECYFIKTIKAVLSEDGSLLLSK